MPLGDEVQDLTLALCKRRERLGWDASWGRSREVGQHSCSDSRAEDRLASAHCPDRGHHLLLVGVLEDVPACSCPQGHKYRVLILEERYHKDAHARALLEDPSRGLYAVYLRHLQVHQDHVWLQLGSTHHSLLARFSLADDLQLG